MYTQPQLYVPSKVVMADPEKLSGLLLVIGDGPFVQIDNMWKPIHFFQFMSLDAKRLEDVVETFSDPSLRVGGRKIVDSHLQNAAQNGEPQLYPLPGLTTMPQLYLNPKIKGADRYDLGIVPDWATFWRDSLEVALGYFADYDPQVKENLYKT